MVKAKVAATKNWKKLKGTRSRIEESLLEKTVDWVGQQYLKKHPGKFDLLGGTFFSVFLGGLPI